MINENSIITVSSVAPSDVTKNVFRSRFALNEVGNPDMMTKFLGHKVGDIVEATAGNILHQFTVHSVRELPPVPEVVEPVALVPDAPPEAVTPETV